MLFDFIRFAVSSAADWLAQKVAGFFGRVAARVMSETDAGTDRYTTEEQAETVKETAVLMMKHTVFEIFRFSPAVQAVLWLQGLIPVPVSQLIGAFVSVFIARLETSLVRTIDGVANDWRREGIA